MQKRAAIRDAYRQANQLRVAARRAREWIRMFHMKYGTCLLTTCFRGERQNRHSTLGHKSVSLAFETALASLNPFPYSNAVIH